MEDIDRERCRPAFEQAIVDDLSWLGYGWPSPVLHQSARLPLYRAALTSLRDRELLYPCFCSRGDVVRTIASRPDWPRDPDGSPLYPGTCRNLDEAGRERRLSRGDKPAWRLDLTRALSQAKAGLTWIEYGEGDCGLPQIAEPELWGDVLLGRRDIGTSYHLAVVVDDAAQAITDVVRGDDLRDATSIHRLLQVLLGYRAPGYHHHRIIVDEHGRKLSKSTGAPSLRAMRAAGISVAAVRALIPLPDG
jgi:glutamyl-Q tRNA(Asp) synthetase